MALKKEALTREFVIQSSGSGKIQLPDPGSNMTPENVMQFYSGTYPELVTSNVYGPEYKGNKLIYTFKTTVGTKG